MKKMIFAALVTMLAITVSAAPAIDLQGLRKALEVGSRATFVAALQALQSPRGAEQALAREAMASAAEVAAALDLAAASEAPLNAVITPAVTAMARTMAMSEARCLGRRERVVAVAGSAAWSILAAGAAELAGDRRAAKLAQVSSELTALTGAAAEDDADAFTASVRRLMRLAE